MRGMMLAVLAAFLAGTAVAGTGDSAIGNGINSGVSSQA